MFEEFVTLFPYWKERREGAGLGKAINNWIMIGGIGFIAYKFIFSPDPELVEKQRQEELAAVVQATMQAKPTATPGLREGGISLRDLPEGTPVPAPTEGLPHVVVLPPAPTEVPGLWDDLGVLPSYDSSGGQGQKVTLLVTHYKPQEGGTNCYRFVNGQCTSRTSSGVPWEHVVNVSAACPWEWPNYSTFEVEGRVFICLDRGSMVCKDGICHVDILTDKNIDGVYPGRVWLKEK